MQYWGIITNCFIAKPSHHISNPSYISQYIDFIWMQFHSKMDDQRKGTIDLCSLCSNHQKVTQKHTHKKKTFHNVTNISPPTIWQRPWRPRAEVKCRHLQASIEYRANTQLKREGTRFGIFRERLQIFDTIYHGLHGGKLDASIASLNSGSHEVWIEIGLDITNDVLVVLFGTWGEHEHCLGPGVNISITNHETKFNSVPWLKTKQNNPHSRKTHTADNISYY